jgi:hypothetical protein
MKIVKCKESAKSHYGRSVLFYNPTKGLYSFNSGIKLAVLQVNTTQLISLRSGEDQYLDQISKELGVDRSNFIIEEQFVEDVSVNHAGEHTHLVSVIKTENTSLPFGTYKLVTINHTDYLKPIKMDSTIIKVGDNRIHNEVAGFFKDAPVGRRNKKGILAYGRPGNGKTSDIMQLDVLIPQDMIILQDFAEVFKNKNTVVILEETTQMLERGALESILSFLDGEYSWDNCVTVCTTNYPDDFPSNIIDRPGRIDTFIEYKNPSSEEITALVLKFGLPADDALPLQGKDLSFDYVSHVCSIAKQTGEPVSKVYNDMKDRRKFLSETFKGKMGL